MICANGGHLIAPEGDDAVVHHLDQASLDTVLEYSEAHQIHISIYTRDRLYFLRDTDWGEAYSRRVRSVRPITMPPDEVRRQPVLKLLLMDHPDRIPGHIQAMAPRIDPNRCRMTESEPEYLEFMPSHVSKGAALASLAGNLGIPQNRVAAVGDYLNDLEMLTFAGHSAAMSNGAEATKLAADRVVRSNDEGGVAEFIDILLAG
jgi:Cof subfamily protein (haloacid dehalogenase superfamily)